MSWRPLPTPTSTGIDLPALLISTIFLKDAYTVHLTDLTHIWTESIDRKAIIRRSHDVNTSIDPSSGPGQFDIFLKKVQLGLNGSPNTSLALTIGSADEGRPNLEIGVTVDLPGGLAPLEWPIQLSEAEDATIKSYLIMPLLRAQHMQHKEIEGLREVIRDKDHVIQKVVDKLETMGTDLGQIFAQAASRPGRKGEWNKDRVKGMAAFDQDKWRKGLHADQPRDFSALLEETFGSHQEGSFASLIPTDAVTKDEKEWWGSISGLTVNLGDGKISTNRDSKKTRNNAAKRAQASPSPSSSANVPNISNEPSFVEEDAFEPLPASPKPEEETEDDEDLPNPPEGFSTRRVARKSSSPLPLPVSKPKKTFGKIGGKKQAGPDPKPEPELEPEPKSQASKAKTVITETTSESSTVPRPKKRLGQIGGKKKEKETTPKLEPDPKREPEISQPALTLKKKLDIASHERSVPKAEELEDQPRGRAAIKPEQSASPPPRETSDDRADKKREQLKRELEQKAKAPTKKKRKL